MKTTCKTLVRLTILALVSAPFPCFAQAKAQTLQPDATEQLIAHAGAMALAGSEGHGGPNTHANVSGAGFSHRPGDFFGATHVGPGKVTYRIVWNDSTVIIGFGGRNHQVHSDMFWDAREKKKGLSKILGKSGFMIYVPKRFYEDFEAVIPAIEKDLQPAGRDVGRRKLIITGHSMGGLWSHYLAMALLEKGKPVDTVVTFGTPYVARPDFQRYLEGLAKEKGTRLLAVENHFDSGIRNWMEKVSAGIHRTPLEYQNRVGTRVQYAFRAGEHNGVKYDEHNMGKYFEIAKFRAKATPDVKQRFSVDGGTVFLSPAVDAGQKDKVQIQLLKPSGTWWKALKVVDIHGKEYWLEWENGKFLNPQNKTKPGELWLSRNALEDRLRIHFWKAKEFGIHRGVHEHDVNLITAGKNRIAIGW